MKKAMAIITLAITLATSVASATTYNRVGSTVYGSDGSHMTTTQSGRFSYGQDSNGNSFNCTTTSSGRFTTCN